MRLRETLPLILVACALGRPSMQESSPRFETPQPQLLPEPVSPVPAEEAQPQAQEPNMEAQALCEEQKSLLRHDLDDPQNCETALHAFHLSEALLACLNQFPERERFTLAVESRRKKCRALSDPCVRNIEQVDAAISRFGKLCSVGERNATQSLLKRARAACEKVLGDMRDVAFEHLDLAEGNFHLNAAQCAMGKKPITPLNLFPGRSPAAKPDIHFKLDDN